jgi:hypothetical protein
MRADNSVGEPNRFSDARAEIRQLLQMRPVQWSFQIWDVYAELVLQLREGLWALQYRTF